MNYVFQKMLEVKNIDNYIDLKKFLVVCKNIKYIENDEFLVLTRNKYINNVSKLDYNSYFTIISKNPFQLLNTFYDYTYFNSDCISLLCKTKILNYTFDMYESLDGKLITVFFYKNSWYYISLHSLNSKKNREQLSSAISLDLLENSILSF